ncbi:MAG: hypothetical protein HZB51_34290 [Chloroflexi bacterium]|nr:hypothetical protein [Chloroflexota bacterium]
MYQSPPTKNNYVLGEVISALQKEIRRGKEKEAMFWAMELIPQFEVYLWKRLIVIVNEDIGIANPTVLLLVPLNRDLFFEMRSVDNGAGNGSARLILANTILAMCRSEKSRISDHFQCVVNQERRHGKLIEIPDYALDKHTRRGKALKRGAEHFVTEGTKLANASQSVTDPYETDAKKWWTSPKFIKDDEWGTRKGTGKRRSPESEVSEENDQPNPTLFD